MSAILPPQSSNSLPVAMTIAGSDSGGGAGIQADILTLSAFGIFATTAITCVTAQNPAGVSAIEAIDPLSVGEQMEQVVAYFPVKALKTGMLFHKGIIATVADFLEKNRHIAAVIDPVMVASSGALLLQPEAVEAVKEKLLPLATIITPNLDEVKVLLGESPTDREGMREAARALASTYGAAVLVKGGHLQGDRIDDVFYEPGSAITVIEAKRIRGINTHGSGCILSAAITAGLAREKNLPASVHAAHAYLQRGMHTPLQLQGQHFIAHGV